MELKFNGSAHEALGQINRNAYADRFTLDGLPVTKVGISFSLDRDKKNITDWIME